MLAIQQALLNLMNRQLTYISVQAPSQPARVHVFILLQLKHIHDIVVEYVELEKDLMCKAAWIYLNTASLLLSILVMYNYYV